MKNILKLSFFLVAILLVSCTSKEKDIEKLKSETIAIHDEVMPKMDDIMKLKKALKAKKDTSEDVKPNQVQDLILALEEADEAMMNWMRNYDPRMEAMSDEEKIAYLKRQKKSIEEVSEKMKFSISEAEAFLNQ
ncbi:hypothetical protein MATR_28010 [Marivirga tractuosa]|uniref:Viral A-type inclusion protein n=1 Tax=Marivirga tractuosa (strain ATCC 23168 / DSM 4126 / NBRC 15989 / NCIMB 1408 / VKM B-1430 / H-43) TaxID=643867 RepID=E4TLS1_MARTH|nr:hypothetical protein [Marivirga tractuosa]ADR23350.1 hypothetical protein Ftrac_3376 [Marivirga tractuosa DSM 4126]BDD15976.1 hypothetical protein MATR_28010 [Marivirga tractuosa]